MKYTNKFIRNAERNQRTRPNKNKFLLQIYNSLIGSVLQYDSCVWQIGNDRPHGPGLLRHEPSVNAIAVFLYLRLFQ
jgi:hypothetical protein